MLKVEEMEATFAIIKEDYIDEAVENAYVENMVYEAGAGPVLVKVVDPLVIPSGDFTIAFKDSSATGDPCQYVLGNIRR